MIKIYTHSKKDIKLTKNLLLNHTCNNCRYYNSYHDECYHKNTNQITKEKYHTCSFWRIHPINSLEN